MSMLRKSGLVLIALGLLLPLLGVDVPSIAVFYYDPDPPLMGNAYPAALFEDSPTSLADKAGQTIEVKIVCKDELGKVVSVTCTIYRKPEGGSYSKYTTLTLAKDDAEWASSFWGYKWYKSWTVPSEDGYIYKFEFKAVDQAGNVGRYVTYGAVSAVYPDGYFTVNGERVTPGTVKWVREPTIDIEFHATKYPEKIDEIRVSVAKGGSVLKVWSLTKKDAALWGDSYTFPEPGKYEVKGYIVRRGRLFEKMSIVIGWGEGGEPGGFDWRKLALNWLTILGLLLFIAGWLKER